MATPNMLEKAIWLKLFGMGPIPPILGNVFFVSVANGDNLFDGRTPDTPFATITYALTQCVALHDDYIFVMDITNEVVALTITRVHLIGVGTSRNHPYCIWNQAADTSCITVATTASNCEIAGFSFGGGGTSAGIENVAGTPEGLYIHDCVFGHPLVGDTPQDGILISLNATNIRIEHCTFLGADAAAKVGGTITRDGIRFEGAADPLNGVFANNRFLGIPGVSVNLDCSAGNGGWSIEDNYFYIPINDGLAAGWAITLQTNVEGCLINNNFAMQTGDNTGNNPYRDLSTGLLATLENGWGINYSGQLSQVPATA